MKHKPTYENTNHWLMAAIDTPSVSSWLTDEGYRKLHEAIKNQKMKTYTVEIETHRIETVEVEAKSAYEAGKSALKDKEGYTVRGYYNSTDDTEIKVCESCEQDIYENEDCFVDENGLNFCYKCYNDINNHKICI